MKRIIIPFVLLLLALNLHSQVFKMDTLQYAGPADKFINIVILGDGYTATQQDTFISDAGKLSSYLLNQSPWNHYKTYFNVIAIRVISNQSGVKHPQTAFDCDPNMPIFNPDNYFGSTFDAFGIHRLAVPMNSAKIASVLATNFPNYDQILVLVNTPYYGGSGGSYATSTLHGSSSEIVAHEVGHSFAILADEYYAGDGYSSEKANMTQETDSLKVKWKNWHGDSGIGIYQHCCSGNSALWYRPHNNCKMRVLNAPYCSVCSQTIVESIHKLVNPLISYTPVKDTVSAGTKIMDFKLTQLMKPVPNTLHITWILDGKTIAYDQDSIKMNSDSIAKGVHKLVVVVTDTTSLLRVDDHASIHASTVSWTIQNGKSGISRQSISNNITCSVYPNPASDHITVSLELEKECNVSIDIMSPDGKLVKSVRNIMMNNGTHTLPVNIENLSGGIYMVVVRIGDLVHTEKLVKR